MCSRFGAQPVITLGFYFFPVTCRACWTGGVYTHTHTHTHPRHPSDVYLNIGGQSECNYSGGDWLGAQLCLISGCFEPSVCLGEKVNLQSCKSLHNQNVAHLSKSSRTSCMFSERDDPYTTGTGCWPSGCGTDVHRRAAQETPGQTVWISPVYAWGASVV